MPIAKPPISPDVAEIIGKNAEKVENRSLLLRKFVVHKSWPEDDVLRRKLDDAVRWSFIRCAENGETILRAERKKQDSVANGRNTQEDKRREAEQKSKILGLLMSCNCRKLSDDVETMRMENVAHLLDLVKKSSLDHRILYGHLESRLAINLSDSLVQNAGICLDRLFGVPYLPGSAIKGVCRHVALEELRSGRLPLADFQDIFGTADVDFTGELKSYRGEIGHNGILETKKGCIDFLSAYPENTARLMVDLTNVHFPNYYQSGRETELRNEQPRPNPFPVVEAGADFPFCLVLNPMSEQMDDPERPKTLLETAMKILRRAMEEWGFGAKTGAGYGWFKDRTAEILAEEEIKAAQTATLVAETTAIEEVTSQITELEGLEVLPSTAKKMLDEMEQRLAANRRPQAQPLRDRMNSLRHKLPKESFADQLARMMPNEIVGQYIARFKDLDDEKKLAIVEFFRSIPQGRELWIQVHADKKLKKKCNEAQDVHAFMNQRKLPKIPCAPL